MGGGGHQLPKSYWRFTKCKTKQMMSLLLLGDLLNVKRKQMMSWVLTIKLKRLFQVNTK